MYAQRMGGVSRAWPGIGILGLTMGKRKQYANAEKIALARKASLPGCSIASVARGEGLPQSTVRGFIKNIKKLEEENCTVENNLKAITQKDKTPTITKALVLICERSRSVKPPVPVTVESLLSKAKNIATKL
jgi:hypothetical protein